ncbi:MAG: class II fumarate hydratase, partial [Candidatus Obscuribacterales bacterium]|nr:class II fumarate hydratase [Candidatus Obscuribacterales bacterium]
HKSVLHPNDHVNACQSSNDVIPSALHLSALTMLERQHLPSLGRLATSLSKKARRFERVVKSGRTHLNDATPVTLGQEFSGYAAQVREARKAIKQVSRRLAKLTIGGTAVGTGVNASPGFGKDVCALLTRDLGFTVRKTDNHFRSQSTVDDAVALSGTLRMLSVALIKICNDLRFMGSGPRAGMGELLIPAVQPGSSIMPGKVNPVIAESVLMVAVQVIGNDAAIAVAGQSGNFELNVMLPLVAYNLLQSISLLSAATDNLRTRLIDGLEATDRGPANARISVALATALAPEIGYDAAARIAKLATASGESIFDVACRETDIDPERLEVLLDPVRMTRPGI